MLPRALPGSLSRRLRRNQRTSMGTPVLWTGRWAEVREVEWRPSQPTTSAAWIWGGPEGGLTWGPVTRGLSCSMRTVTSMPARARRRLSIMPAGPPPTMQQVVLDGAMAGMVMGGMRVARVGECVKGDARCDARVIVLDSTHPILLWRAMMCVRGFACVAAVASIVSCSFVSAQSASPAASDEARGKVWWAHVQYLANDSMKGRLTGSEEYLQAAAYVVDQFKSYGLQPAGVNGYYQPVRFDVQRVVADRSSLSLVVDGKAEPLVLGKDAILGVRSAQRAVGNGPLMFIGC